MKSRLFLRKQAAFSDIKYSHFFCILQLTENNIFVIIKMDFYFMKKE